MYTVAVCEDQKDTREEAAALCGEVLTDLEIEHHIAAFSSAEELETQLLTGDRFDLLCLDILMDGESGMELAKKLRMTDDRMVEGQDALIAVLGLDLQLRLQHFQNFRHVLGLALQRDHLDMLPRVRFCLVVFQQIKERIGVALTLKVSGGDRGGIVLRGQVVDLF